VGFFERLLAFLLDLDAAFMRVLSGRRYE